MLGIFSRISSTLVPSPPLSSTPAWALCRIGSDVYAPRMLIMSWIEVSRVMRKEPPTGSVPLTYSATPHASAGKAPLLEYMPLSTQDKEGMSPQFLPHSLLTPVSHVSVHVVASPTQLPSMEPSSAWMSVGSRHSFESKVTDHT